ncbi:PAS domain-containing protein [Halopelagius longus]|uniref:histidine kinase n=1 Tax=Halopelagius longus TaxID=1236180 RepID=A0A1H0Y0Q4_9EURY|nr:PAS domain-containing protein [Halopelagius longus]RDI72211.1 PAS domain S-box protein [Halopelagius longus]SDQ08703.1 PAS domain S-box-containing protein [Halopelagius longus]
MHSSTGSDTEPDARIRQQEVVAELGQQALETDDLDQLMHDASAAVAETLDNEYAKVLELLPGGDEVFLRQGVGWREGLVGSATVPTDRDSQAGYTLLSEAPVVVDDLRTEERFSGPELLTSHGVVSGISVVIGSVAEPWGVLGTHTTAEREFSPHDAHFVKSVANVLASAIENQQTKSELEEIYGRISDAFFALDEEWRFTYVNEQAHELINPHGRTLLGEDIWDVFPAATERKFKPEYERAMYEQETVAFEEYYPEPLDSWFEVRAYPSETGLSVYFRDTTHRKKRERELEETERRFEAIFEDPNILVGLLDTDGTVLDINRTAMEYIDADLEEVTGEPFWETPWWGDGDEVQADVKEWTERAASGEYVDFEADLSHPSGERYAISGVFRPVTNDDGDVVSVIVSDRDVTERREYERQLEESERRYRTLAESFPNGIVTMYGDDLRYTLAEGRAFEYLPVSKDDLEGRTPREVWGEEVGSQLGPALRDALDGEERAVEVSYVDREWVVYAVPITDTDGNVFAGMTMAQDITDRKEYERRLAESERRYRTLAEHFPNGAVGVYDRDLRYTLTAGRLLGEKLPTSDVLEGQRMPDVFPEHTVDDLEPLFRSAVEEGETDNTTTEFGGRNWQVWVTPLRDVDGDVFAGLSFTQDITEQVERERQLEELIEKLEESNERLEQFAYAASHDLQEPLRMVSSYLRLLERRYEGALDEDGEEFLEYAVDGADRMREMIDALLKYSRVETKGDPLEPIELDEVLDDVFTDLQLHIEETGADITAESLPRVEGDANQLRQLLQNLLDNALTYSGEEPPRVEITTRRSDGKWVISVSDNGVGIDPEDTDTIFEVFQRLHGREEHPGTGIGLALCERIVERHGGDIWVESEPGEGSTFSFTLPVAGESDE